MTHLDDSQLNEYLDGALPAGERRLVSAHLGACDSCRARLNEIQLVFDRLAGLSEAPLSHDLTPGILTRLPQKRQLWTPVLAIQFLLALGIFIWLLSRAPDLIKLPAFSAPALSNVAAFRLPQVNIVEVNRLLTTINLRPSTINFLFTVPNFQVRTAHWLDLASRINLPHFQNWINNVPAWRYPLSGSPSFLIIIPALLLWIFGNVLLLRDRSEAEK